MSINTIDYTMQLRPVTGLEKKKRIVYARPVLRGKVGNKELAQELMASTTLTETDITAVLTGLGTQLVKHLRRGELVTLNGIGSFSVRIKSEQTTDKQGKVKMDDLHVSGILFRPAEEILSQVREVSFRLTAGPSIKMPSDEEITSMLTEHFSTMDYITSTNIAEYLHVSRRRSHQIASLLVDKGVLARRGKGPTTHYVLSSR